METSDLISSLAILVAAVSAVYTRAAFIQMRKANNIAVRKELKPHRLAVYNTTKDFLHYCATYRTMQFVKMITGTNNLSTRIEEFKWEIDQYGPLAMPEVENKIENIIKNAWQLQRILDRLAGADSKPLNSAYNSAEENLDVLIDWFASEEKDLRKLFEKFLRIT